MIHTFEMPVYYTVEVNDETGEVNVYSSSKHKKGRMLAKSVNESGYLRVKMNNRGCTIHSLVARCFFGDRPTNLVVNHKDCNKLNNAPGNLEYVTIAENINHSVKNGMHVSNDPKRSGRYKDGRAINVKQYKQAWYQQNREAILKKAKESYRSRM